MTLEEYSRELNLYGVMTVEDLIKSHRTLREHNRVRSVVWQDELRKGRELGEKQGRLLVTEGEYISVEKLKEMTLQQVCELINSPE